MDGPTTIGVKFEDMTYMMSVYLKRFKFSIGGTYCRVSGIQLRNFPRACLFYIIEYMRVIFLTKAKIE